MNFFGHAVVAAWSDNRGEHLLGSMLPDFEAMVRVSLVEVHDPCIQQGIDLHHQTDQAFHRAPAFVALCARALSEMTELGVRRGTARAVAHVGTELFLDGWLAREGAHIDAYLGALEVETRDRLEWEDDGEAFRRLRTRLSTWGAPSDYSEPEFVLARLADSLRSRPALALLHEESLQIAGFLSSMQQLVERAAAELLQQIRDGLGFES